MIKFSVLFLLAGLSSQAAEPFVDSPTGCLSSRHFPCAVRAGNAPLKLEKANGVFVLAKFSSIHFLSAQQFQMLKGSAWIEKSKNLGFKLSPSLDVSLNGEFFISRLWEKTHIKNLQGTAQFASSLIFKSEALPVGFENWYGRINTAGVIERGIIKPIDLKSFLLEWVPLAQNSVAELRKKVLEYQSDWAGGAELSSNLYREVVERSMASVAQKELTHAQQMEKAQAEIRKLRDLYRKRNNLDGPE